MSAGKVTSVFWETEEILMVDFIAKGQTNTGTNYNNQLRHLEEEFKRKHLAN